MKGLVTVFVSVFIAELGDKTEMATFLFATDANLSRSGVFIASSLALVLSSLLAVTLGRQISQLVPPATLMTAAGIGFIIIGIWVLISART